MRVCSESWALACPDWLGELQPTAPLEAEQQGGEGAVGEGEADGAGAPFPARCGLELVHKPPACLFCMCFHSVMFITS